MKEPINNQSMLKVGTVLRGIYRIDSYLSSGGFGNTYVATNIEFDERVAVKEFFMRGVTQRDGNQTTVSVSNIENQESFLQQREKFKKEARRLRQLNNPHIVRVHDLFEENGTAYYVMDYVDGENLSDRLKRTGRPMTESEVNLILPQILDALKSVHDADIWHLDLKPANIMLEKGGNIKLIDFGASKQLNAQKGGATTSTAISYTNGYAPREQMEQNYDKFGPWTDIYALGATLYSLLTNKRPPLPTDIDDDISEDKHLALPMLNVSDAMKNLVLCMMNTNRMQRPQNVNAISLYTSEKEKISNSQDISTKENSDNDEETIFAETIKKIEADTILSNDKKDVNIKDSNIVNYLSHPFNNYVVCSLSLIMTICVLGYSIQVLFSDMFDRYAEPFAMYYLFYIINIIFIIPFIIGIKLISSKIAYLMILSQIIVLARLFLCKLLESQSQFYLYYIIEDSILFWGLFLGHFVLYCICGIIMVKEYKGNLCILGKCFILYSLLSIILNVKYYMPYIEYLKFNLVSGMTYIVELLSFIWAIDLIFVYSIWWMFTRKPRIKKQVI